VVNRTKAGQVAVAEVLMLNQSGERQEVKGTQALEIRPLPAEYTLLPNYPNPFNSSTHLGYGLPAASQVSLSVYDLLGQEVKRLVKEWKPAGYHQIVWDGRDDAGKPVASGVYLYRLESQGQMESRRLLLLK
jgi:hypothetical protein